MKRKIDPQVIKWIKQTIECFPKLTEKEVINLVPMLMSDDSEIRECAAEIIYGTNWINMNNTISAFIDCCKNTPLKIIEIINILNSEKYIENEYDNNLAKIIHDENFRLFKASKIYEA